MGRSAVLGDLGARRVVDLASLELAVGIWALGVVGAASVGLLPGLGGLRGVVFGLVRWERYGGLGHSVVGFWVTSLARLLL